jgi:hypothetical protein
LHELAAILGEAERVGDVVTQRADLDAQIAALHGLALAQRLDDRDRLFGGDGEADAHIAARGREDLAVDADHIAVHVEHRTAGVALVDRGVRLDEAVIGAAGAAMDGGDDAGRYRTGQRIGLADCNHPVADPRLGAVAELHEREGLLALDLE